MVFQFTLVQLKKKAFLILNTYLLESYLALVNVPKHTNVYP